MSCFIEVNFGSCDKFVDLMADYLLVTFQYANYFIYAGNLITRTVFYNNFIYVTMKHDLFKKLFISGGVPPNSLEGWQFSTRAIFMSSEHPNDRDFILDRRFFFWLGILNLFTSPSLAGSLSLSYKIGRSIEKNDIFGDLTWSKEQRKVASSIRVKALIQSTGISDNRVVFFCSIFFFFESKHHQMPA